MFSVSRPMQVVVLNDCVTETKVTSLRVEHVDQLGEVHQRAGEPVDLVDDHDIDQPGLDVGEQPLQRRPLQRAAGDAAVVVAVGHQHPALGPLAGDVGLAGLALRVEGVELLSSPSSRGSCGCRRRSGAFGRPASWQARLFMRRCPAGSSGRRRSSRSSACR